MAGRETSGAAHGEDANDLAQLRAWAAWGTELFLGAVRGMQPDQWDEPSALPGWRRRHVVAHVHHNAEALQRLAGWARTGVEAAMYPSHERRQADIEHSAGLPIEELHRLLPASAQALDADLDALSTEQWGRQIIVPKGRVVPATEIPWLRCREVTIHAVDLAVGIGFDDIPPALAEALVHDAVATRLRRGEAARLAAWLTGRGTSGEDIGTWI